MGRRKVVKKGMKFISVGSGRILTVVSRATNIHWNCHLQGSKKNHKTHEGTLYNKGYYKLYDKDIRRG